jgi:hypothetical protein
MLVLVLPALAAPAAAVAQSAGDDQYVDPFQNEGSQKDNAKSQSGGGDGSTAPQSAQATPTAAAPEAGAQASDGAALPRTGLPLAGLLVTGFALLGGGFTLRRRA